MDFENDFASTNLGLVRRILRLTSSHLGLRSGQVHGSMVVLKVLAGRVTDKCDLMDNTETCHEADNRPPCPTAQRLAAASPAIRRHLERWGFTLADRDAKNTSPAVKLETAWSHAPAASRDRALNEVRRVDYRRSRRRLSRRSAACGSAREQAARGAMRAPSTSATRERTPQTCS